MDLDKFLSGILSANFSIILIFKLNLPFSLVFAKYFSFISSGIPKSFSPDIIIVHNLSLFIASHL